MDETNPFAEVGDLLCSGDIESARATLSAEMPFEQINSAGRSYTTKQKLSVFFRDGFIDRYSGKQLINPGYLRSLSKLFPDVFPFHTNWKMSSCHQAFWLYSPTVDHLVPVARGGPDCESNWVTTNMLMNSAKSNWTLDELHWKLYPAGELDSWDGLSRQFIALTDKYPELLEDKYIKDWSKTTRLLLEI